MAEWDRNIAWRQGHLLCDHARNALGFDHPTSPSETLAIVATHDCDLAQDPAREPNVEVVIGRLIAKGGDSTHAKNARRLHLQFDGDNSFWAEFEAAQKRTTSKSELSKFSPRKDATLSGSNLATLQKWLASRYRRSAYPEEFERRIKNHKLDEKIAKTVKKHGEWITAVFIDVDDGKEVERNGSADTYVVDILILFPTEVDYENSERAAKEAAEAITAAFKAKLFTPTKQWCDIELRDCQEVSEAAITYDQFKLLRRWNLDHMSLATEPQQPLVQE